MMHILLNPESALADPKNANSTIHYNWLLGIFQADNEVRKGDLLSRFLLKASVLFQEHGMENDVGVFLLHKHNDLAFGERMVEREGEYRNSPALITSRSFSSEGCIPARWAVSKGGEYIPLEYTCDPMASIALDKLFRSDGFLKAYSDLLGSHGLNRLLGLCLADRGMFHSAPDDTLVLIEESYPDVGNVVRWTKPDERTESLIQTIWTFPATAGIACRPMCKRYCVPRSPGHAGEHYPIHAVVA